jgi:signal transduction histidine kinase
MPDNPVKTPIPFIPKHVQFVPGRTIVIALYLFAAAEIGRMLAWFANVPEHQALLPWFIAMDAVYLALFSWMMWRPAKSPLGLYLYFFIQSAQIVIMVILAPGMDFTPGLFTPLSYQVALNLRGRPRQAWIAIFLILTIIPLILIQDPLRNLALGLPNMAGIFVLATYISTSQEEEIVCAQGEAMLAELQQTNRQLQEYTRQIDELAAIEERNRLARELHDSVSQTIFSAILNIRATQLLMERDPSRVPAQLATLGDLAQSALAEMRGLIAQMRPKGE